MTVFHNTKKRVENATEYFDEIRGVWIANEALFQVFDIIFSIETKHKE